METCQQRSQPYENDMCHVPNDQTRSYKHEISSETESRYDSSDESDSETVYREDRIATNEDGEGRNPIAIGQTELGKVLLEMENKQ